MTDQQAIAMFGCTEAECKAEFERMCSFSGSLGMVIGSMLSDVQEMIERDMKERARQALNRVKYHVFNRDELKGVLR